MSEATILNATIGVASNSLTHAFYSKNAEPIRVFRPDGEMLWRGRIVETDAELRQAVIDLRNTLVR